MICIITLLKSKQNACVSLILASRYHLKYRPEPSKSMRAFCLLAKFVEEARKEQGVDSNLPRNLSILPIADGCLMGFRIPVPIRLTFLVSAL